MGKNAPDRLTDGELIERCRALGDDYAAYGLKLPEQAREPLRESLREGYRAGLARVGMRNHQSPLESSQKLERHETIA